MEQNRCLLLGNRLEGILRGFLDCGYNDFGVKSNSNLTSDDWRKPVFFALGYLYCRSEKSPKTKDDIENFIDNFKGQSIEDVVGRYEYFGFESQDEAFQYVEDEINELKNLLS